MELNPFERSISLARVVKCNFPRVQSQTGGNRRNTAIEEFVNNFFKALSSIKDKSAVSVLLKISVCSDLFTFAVCNGALVYFVTTCLMVNVCLQQGGRACLLCIRMNVDVRFLCIRVKVDVC